MDFLTHEREYRTKEVLEKRSKINILILGLGALGSNLIPLLIKNGFTNITGLDMDRVDSHNIGNQIYTLLDTGRKKTQIMSVRMHREMGTKINTIDLDVFKFPKKNFKKFDLIIDTFDNWEAREFVKNTCSELEISDRLLHSGMSDTGYSEIKWDENYEIPEINSNQDEEDVCEYPLACNLVYFTVVLISEIICEYSDNNIRKNKFFTLRDTNISTI